MTQQPTQALVPAGRIDQASPAQLPVRVVDAAPSSRSEPVFAHELSTHSFGRDDPALVAVHDASCCLCGPSWVDRIPDVVLGGGMLTGMAGVTVLVAWLPRSTLWVLGLAFVGLIGVAAISTRRTGAWAIAPHEIADRELRAGYYTLLTAQHELATALVRQRDGSPLARGLLDDSRDTVVACSRLAHATNPAQRYLATHSLESIDASVARLRDVTTACRDDATGQLLAATDTAYERQRTMVDGLIVVRDRARAELALATARIEAATAEVAKLQTIDATALAGAAGGSGHAQRCSASRPRSACAFSVRTSSSVSPATSEVRGRSVATEIARYRISCAAASSASRAAVAST